MAFSDTRATTKGFLLVPERNNLMIRFQFNPSEYTESHEAIYPKHPVPGASHPVYQYGAGGERLISFTLYFDADLGYQRQDAESKDFVVNGNVLSLRPILNKIRSLTYPIVQNGSGIKQIYAPIAYLETGNLFENKRTQCIVKKADPRVTFYSAGLEPLKAQVTVELAQIVDRRVTAQQVQFGRYT